MTSETLVETTNADGYVMRPDGSWLDPRTMRVFAINNGGYTEIKAKGTALQGEDTGPIDPECGFGLYTREHMRGKDLEGNGLHGHERTSKKVADEQRADAFARAAEFAESQAAAAPERLLAAIEELETENESLKQQLAEALKKPPPAKS